MKQYFNWLNILVQNSQNLEWVLQFYVHLTI